MQKAKAITKCRVCSSKKLLPVLSLGKQYSIDFLDSKKDARPKIPLELVLCDRAAGGCGLLQLRHTTPISQLYRQFWYVSGVNQTMRNALADVTRCAEKIVPLRKGDVVVDIGSNDSTLLRAYHNHGIVRVGFEPATNLMEKARRGGLSHIINSFFNYKDYQKEIGKKKAKIITAVAMFYDLNDPNTFMNDIEKMLDADGLFIIQMNYLPLMIKQNVFDHISHEHLEYYSLTTLEYLLAKHGFEIIDAELNDINGGSVRAYIRRIGSPAPQPLSGAKKRLDKLRREERNMGLHHRAAYTSFAHRVNAIKKKLLNFITTKVKQGKKVYVYGASQRGNTILQFCELKPPLITAAADRNPMKWGKIIIGSWIPIISEERAREERPDYFLVLPWHFFPEFKKREKKFLQAGGKFILPVPRVKIVGR